MKQKLFILAFLFFGTTIYSQEYKPLLDNLNEWHLTSCYSGCITDVYFTDGDTLVAAKNYKILDGFHYISRTFLIREDVASQKVYLRIISAGTGEEYLLYDFSLNEGSTHIMQNPLSPFPENGGAFILDSIVERPLVDGEQYKHYYFTPAPGNTISTENAVWIEGVGSLSMINAPGGVPDINRVGHLSCFFKNSEAFYANLDSISDCTPLILQTQEFPLQNVVVSKKSNTNICLLSHAQNVKSYAVFDLTGKRLGFNSNTGKNEIAIDFSNFQKGIYIVVISGYGDSKRALKVVK